MVLNVRWNLLKATRFEGGECSTKPKPATGGGASPGTNGLAEQKNTKYESLSSQQHTHTHKQTHDITEKKNHTNHAKHTPSAVFLLYLLFRSICVDLKSSEGREMIRELASVSDVLIENFRPGKMEEWGLGPKDLVK